MEFRLASGQTRAGVIAQATQIARGMEAQIPSKSDLYR
jgi:hypothetical protein